MTLDELVVALTFDIDDKPLKDFSDKVVNLGTSIAALAGTMAAGATAIFGVAKATANAGDEAIKMAQKVGMNVEKLQELIYAGSLADLTAEQIGGSMRFLNRNLEQAATGSKEAAEGFKDLGIDIKNADGSLKGSDQIMSEVAARFEKMPDGIKKSAVAMKIFGKSGADLIPLLNGGAEGLSKAAQEARDYGLIIDEEAARASEEFNDNLTRLQAMATGITRTVGAKLIPIIGNLVDKIMDFVKANRGVITSKIDRFFSGLAVYVERAWRILMALTDAVEGLLEVFGGLENVLKAIGVGFLIFTSGSILYGIGKLIGAFSLLGKMITLANLKALMIPILIGAAVVALGLIIEDIVSFFQGKDSVTGIIVEKFKAMFAELEKGFDGLGSTTKGFITALLTPLRALIGMFQNILDLVDVVRGKMDFKDFAGNVGKRLLANFGVGLDGSLKGALGLTTTEKKEPAGQAAQAVSASRTAPAGPLQSPSRTAPEAAAPLMMAPPASVSQSAGIAPTSSDIISPIQRSSSVNLTAENNITVYAAEGQSPSEVGRAVAQETNGGLDGILRGAQRSFSGGSN